MPSLPMSQLKEFVYTYVQENGKTDKWKKGSLTIGVDGSTTLLC